MSILLWLAAPLAVTALAMLWALWAGHRQRFVDAHARTGRPRRHGRRHDTAYERFSAAVQRPVPPRARKVATRQPERPSGIAVRPSQRRAR